MAGSLKRNERRRIVKREYAKILRAKQRKHKDDVKDSWARNWGTHHHADVQEGVATEASQSWANGQKHAHGSSVISTAPIKKYRANLRKKITCTMKAVTPIPTMYTWSSTQRNIVDEEDLENSPQMGLTKDMVKNCGGEVRANKKPSFMNDFIFIDLVHALMKHFRSDPATADTVVKTERSSVENLSIICNEVAGGGTQNMPDICDKKEVPFPPTTIFQAIADTYPGRGTAYQMREKYIELKERPDPAGNQTYIPNIDGEKAISASADETLHSFHALFCRRCFIYDCSLHRKDTQPLPNKENRNFPYEKPLTEPCSSSCYMLRDVMKEKRAAASQVSPRMSNNASVDRNITRIKIEDPNGAWPIKNEVDEVVAGTSASAGQVHSYQFETKFERCFNRTTNSCIWTGADQSLFRVLTRVFPRDFCRISQVLCTKTCQQIFEFAQNEAMEEAFEDIDPDFKPPRKNPRQYRSWLVHSQKVNNKKDPNAYSYTPCNHIGPCDSSCSCISSKNFCEKYCNCSSNCVNRFPGCRCKRGCNTKHCPCYLALRECDADLCQTCGADQFSLNQITCKNVCVQRSLRKHLLLAPSDIAGWGIFLKEGAQKNEFISEYCGEIISQEEAERRGKIYDDIKCSYLFNLNSDYVVDATRKGNKMRFANHSINPNCYAKVLMVYGNHRIAIFAKRAIEPGEELFFDYRYRTEQLKFVPIEGASTSMPQQDLKKKKKKN